MWSTAQFTEVVGWSELEHGVSQGFNPLIQQTFHLVLYDNLKLFRAKVRNVRPREWPVTSPRPVWWPKSSPSYNVQFVLTFPETSQFPAAPLVISCADLARKEWRTAPLAVSPCQPTWPTAWSERSSTKSSTDVSTVIKDVKSGWC